MQTMNPTATQSQINSIQETVANKQAELHTLEQEITITFANVNDLFKELNNNKETFASLQNQYNIIDREMIIAKNNLSKFNNIN